MSVPHNQRLVEKCEKARLLKAHRKTMLAQFSLPQQAQVDEKQYILITGPEIPYSSLAQQSIISKISVPFNQKALPFTTVMQHTRKIFVSHNQNNRNLQFHV